MPEAKGGAMAERQASRVRVVLGLLILTALLTAIAYGRAQLGDQIAGILAGLVTALTLLNVVRGPAVPVTDPAVLIPSLKLQLSTRYGDQLTARRLVARQFVAVEISGGTGRRLGHNIPAVINDWMVALRDRRTLAWDAARLQAEILGAVDGAGGRVLVVGQGGGGKSVMALLLAKRIVDRPPGAGPFSGRLPLLVSLASWRPETEVFGRWLDRRLENLYPALQSFAPGEGVDKGRGLIMSGRAFLVLDGLDEIRGGHRVDALRTICAYLPDDVPLVVFSRDVPWAEKERCDLAKITIGPASPSAATAYLRSCGVALPPELEAGLRSGDFAAHRGFLRVLSVPLYLDFLADDQSSSRSLSLAELVTATESRVRRALAWAWLSRVTDGLGYPPGRALRWLTAIAQAMVRQSTSMVAWWRVVDAVPAAAPPAAVALLSAPAYWIAVRMPVGLTRGLAIGLLAAMVFGLGRGRIRLRLRDVLPCTVLTLTCVAAIGLLTYGSAQALVDAVELATALTVASMWRLDFMCRRWWWSFLVAALGGVLVSVLTTVAAVLLGFDDPHRGPVSLWVAGFFGLAIASISARVFMAEPDTMVPSRVWFTRARRIGGLLPSLRAAITCPVLIGAGGGLGGILRGGWEYGLAVFVLFALVIGLPVGLMGGIIGWLSSPAPAGTKRKPASSLRTDRTLALLSIALIALAASLGIAVLRGWLGQVETVILALPHQEFSLQVLDGICFGVALGAVVACVQTAWPAYLVAVIWLAVTRTTPLFLARFLDRLLEEQVLRREGSLLEFRHSVFRDLLAGDRQDLRRVLEPD
jgi:hypothetical protein